jgi:hypothetical protein
MKCHVLSVGWHGGIGLVSVSVCAGVQLQGAARSVEALYTHTHTNTHTQTHTPTHTHTRTYICIRMYVCIYVCMYLYVYIICIYVCMYMYIYICIYIHMYRSPIARSCWTSGGAVSRALPPRFNRFIGFRV